MGPIREEDLRCYKGQLEVVHRFRFKKQKPELRNLNRKENETTDRTNLKSW